MRRGWLAAGLWLVAGCPTDLLLGDTDTEAGSGSSSGLADGADGGGTNTEDGGGGSGDSGATGDDGDTTMGAEAGSSEEGPATEDGTETTEAGMCEATDADTCNGMEGCQWYPDEGICGPLDGCTLLGFDACIMAQGECLWFGVPAEGECASGTCGGLAMEPCGAALICGWLEGACDTLPCNEQTIDACESLGSCEVVGPVADVFCVPDDCLVECNDLDDVMCGEAVGCHFAGEGEDGNCLSVECFECSVLTADECGEATGCDYNVGEMVCQPL